MPYLVSLYDAMCTKLRTDTGAGSLVTLTGHTNAAVAIARYESPTLARRPFLGIEVQDSVAVVPGYTEFQKATVVAHAYSADKVVAYQIADRLLALLKPADARDYYDFSNNSIRTTQVNYRRCIPMDFDEETGTQECRVLFDVFWLNTSCP